MTTPWIKPGISDRLRELVLDSDHSFAEVASILNTEFGTAVTRNSVIGRAGRMGLKISPEKRQRMVRHGATNADRTKRARKPRRKNIGNGGGNWVTRRIYRQQTASELFGVVTDGLKELPHDTSPCAKPLMELINDTSQCRWPVSTPKGEPQLFCADAVVKGRPYCTRHCHLSYYVPGRVELWAGGRAA